MKKRAWEKLDELQRITKLEMQFITLVCRFPEPTVREIAELMGLSHKTVETHRAKVYLKWSVGSTSEILYKAVAFRLVKCPCIKNGQPPDPEAPRPDGP